MIRRLDAVNGSAGQIDDDIRPVNDIGPFANGPAIPTHNSPRLISLVARPNQRDNIVTGVRKASRERGAEKPAAAGDDDPMRR